MEKIFSFNLGCYSIITFATKSKKSIRVEQLIETSDDSFDDEFTEMYKEVVLKEVVECFSNY